MYRNHHQILNCVLVVPSLSQLAAQRVDQFKLWLSLASLREYIDLINSPEKVLLVLVLLSLSNTSFCDQPCFRPLDLRDLLKSARIYI